ncbi:MAG: hypothetical protein AB2L13_21130 [Spirochaetota bacterium]
MKKLCIMMSFLFLSNSIVLSELDTIEWGQNPEQVRLAETGTLNGDYKKKFYYYLHFMEKYSDRDDYIVHTSYTFFKDKLVEKRYFIELIDTIDSKYRMNWYISFYDSVVQKFNDKYGQGKVKHFKRVLDKSHIWITKDAIIITDLNVTEDSRRLVLTFSQKK